MRTSLFLSTLFAVSLVGGLAMAEKGETKVNIHRDRGDMVDKSYRHDARPVNNVTRGTTDRYGTGAKNPTAKMGQERVNCSTDSADCSASHGSSQRGATTSNPAGMAAKTASGKNAIEKFDQSASARTSCNEGDECSMSSKAAKQVWSNHGAQATMAAQVSQPSSAPGGAASRLIQQRTEPRTSQGDSAGGEDASTPSKVNKQFWAYEAVKAGTFHGAVDTSGAGATEKNAQRAVEKMKSGKAQ